MLRIQLFGTTAVTTPHERVLGRDLGGVKPRQILEILAIADGTPVPKDVLAELLWDGRPPRSYLGTLESYVCVLRRRLGVAGGRRSAIGTVMHGYLLDREQVSVDLADFNQLVHEAGGSRRPPAAALRDLERAVDLVGGDLLGDEPYVSWAVRERECHLSRLLAATTTAAGHALAVGQLPTAERMSRLAVAQEPTAEEPCRHLMRVLAATGRTGEALRAYQGLRSGLADELGVDPSPPTTALYLELLRTGDAAGTAADPREEVRALVRLLRDAIRAVPGLALPTDDRDLAELATGLSMAG